MTIPNLKRVKISSQQELKNWLVKHPDDKKVMLVTFNKTSPDKHIDREQLREVVVEHGWVEGRRYTLNGNLIGHVISR